MAGKKERRLPPIHPGEVLRDLQKEPALSINALPLALRVPAKWIGGIVKGRWEITADTALRMARYCGTSAQMWVQLQSNYELETAEDTFGTEPRASLGLLAIVCPPPRAIAVGAFQSGFAAACRTAWAAGIPARASLGGGPGGYSSSSSRSSSRRSALRRLYHCHSPSLRARCGSRMPR